MGEASPDPVTDAVLRRAAKAMSFDFGQLFVRYDEGKYPPEVLERLRLLFARPNWVQPEDIQLALRWKYGRLGKKNYPSHQRRLAKRIANRWSALDIRRGENPQDVLARWQARVGGTSFVTACFMLHLVAPDDWPILDQHNFRAVQHLLGSRTAHTKTKARPSTAANLILVRDFVAGVRRVWTTVNRRPVPSADAVDRYLMMFGKALKRKHMARSNEDAA